MERTAILRWRTFQEIDVEPRQLDGVKEQNLRFTPLGYFSDYL